MMNRRYIFVYIGIIILTGLLWSLSQVTTQADVSNSTSIPPPKWLIEIEREVVGEESQGGLVERINNLEKLMTGKTLSGSLEERLAFLDALLFTNQPYDICLLYKIQALEWVLYHEESSESILQRINKMEKEVFGSVFSGPITKRVEKLIGQVFPNDTIRGRWANIHEGLIIRVRILDELNSLKNKPGDQFRFVLTETIYDANYILFPRGTIGYGVLKEVKHPDNLGRDAQLMVDYAIVRALDATPVRMFYGAKALKMDRSRKLAVSASAAGMVALGPGGILLGLVIKGKETIIPVGTEFYLQVNQPVRIYTIADPDVNKNSEP